MNVMKDIVQICCIILSIQRELWVFWRSVYWGFRKKNQEMIDYNCWSRQCNFGGSWNKGQRAHGELLHGQFRVLQVLPTMTDNWDCESWSMRHLGADSYETLIMSSRVGVSEWNPSWLCSRLNCPLVCT